MKFIAALIGLSMIAHAAQPAASFHPYSWNANQRDNGNGTVTSEIYPSWFNYYNGGAWDKIDVTLDATGTGFYLMNAPYALHLPLYADGPARFVSTSKYDPSTKTVRNDPQISKVKYWTGAAHVPGLLSGSVVIYPNALPIGDVVYEAHNQEFRSLVRINAMPTICADPAASVLIPFTENYSNGLFPVHRGASIGSNDEDVGDGFGIWLNPFRVIVTEPAFVWDSAALIHIKPIEIKGHAVRSNFFGKKVLPCSFFTTAKFPVFTDTTTTFNPGATAVDGLSECGGGVGDGVTTYSQVNSCTSSANFANLGFDYTSTTNLILSQHAGGDITWYIIGRVATFFDTSVIGASSRVSAATYSIWPTAKADNESDSLAVVTASLAGNTSIVNADFDSSHWGTTVQATSKTLASLTTGAYNDYTLNSTGNGNISLTSITKFALRMTSDINNTAPTHAGSSNNVTISTSEGTSSQWPKLVVTYAAAAATIKNHLLFYY